VDGEKREQEGEKPAGPGICGINPLLTPAADTCSSKGEPEADRSL